MKKLLPKISAKFLQISTKKVLTLNHNYDIIGMYQETDEKYFL